jgi:hypothetical protein
MHAVLLMLAMLFLGAGPAAATSTVACSISDANLAFEADATVGHGFGESFTRLAGRIEIRAKAAPDGLRKLEFELEHLAQRWFYGNDLKLRLFRERSGDGPHASVELIVETKRPAKDKNDFRGSYVLNMNQLVGTEEKTVTIRGRAKCQAD